MTHWSLIKGCGFPPEYYANGGECEWSVEITPDGTGVEITIDVNAGQGYLSYTHGDSIVLPLEILEHLQGLHLEHQKRQCPDQS